MLTQRRQLLLSVAALLLALLGTAYLWQRVRVGVALVARPVPVRDLAPGTVVQLTDLRPELFPAQAVVGTLSDPAQLVGQRTRTVLVAGVPIHPSMVGPVWNGLPEGWGEVAVSLPAVAALGGKLEPGETVQALWLRRVGQNVALEALGPVTVVGVEGQQTLLVRLMVPAGRLTQLAQVAARVALGEDRLHLYRHAEHPREPTSDQGTSPAPSQPRGNQTPGPLRVAAGQVPRMALPSGSCWEGLP